MKPVVISEGNSSWFESWFLIMIGTSVSAMGLH